MAVRRYISLLSDGARPCRGASFACVDVRAPAPGA